MIKNKNLCTLLFTCGLMLTSCVTNNSSNTSSNVTSSTPQSTTTSEEKITKSCVELLMDDEYLDDVVASVSGTTSHIVLSSEKNGIIYSINFQKGETVELSATSTTGKYYDYYYKISKTTDEITTNEEIYLDETGKGSFLLDCDSVVVTLYGTLNENWVDPNGDPILEYYNQLNKLIFKGSYRESFYEWIVDVNDFGTKDAAIEYIETLLPKTFRFSLDESETGIVNVYIDSSETYKIEISIYLEDERLTARIVLSYVSGEAVPNPNNNIDDLSDSEKIIREIYSSIYQSNNPVLGTDYFPHINGEPEWFYLEYSLTTDSLETAVNEGLKLMPKNIDVLDGEEYYEYLDEGYGCILCVNDDLTVLVDIASYLTDTDGYFKVVITCYPA